MTRLVIGKLLEGEAMIAALHGDKGRLIGSYAQRQPSRPIRRRASTRSCGANRGIGNRFALPARNLGVRLHAGQSARGVRRFRGAAGWRRTRRSQGTAMAFGSCRSGDADCALAANIFKQKNRCL